MLTLKKKHQVAIYAAYRDEVKFYVTVEDKQSEEQAIIQHLRSSTNPTEAHYINLSGRDFSYCDFSHMSLRGVNFSSCNLKATNFKESKLSGTNFCDANMTLANLSYCNLSRTKFFATNLRGVYMEDTIGDSKFINSIQVDKWMIAYTSEEIQIGCEKYPITEWKEWRKNKYWVAELDGDALHWAEKNLDNVLEVVKMFPATNYKTLMVGGD